MKYYIIFFFVLLHTKTIYSQSFNPAPQTWMIDAETAVCESSTNECLLIKQSGKKEFEIFNEPIEGFNYEKGNIYTIVVKQEIKKPPIAIGESILKYVLVKIISKKPKSNPIILNNNPASSSTQKIFEVNFETVPCETENSKSCLLVKEKGKKEFEILNATIYGFNYQPGYIYTIAVKETSNGNYYLVNEISKKAVKNTSETTVSAESTDESTVKKPKIIPKSFIQTSSSLDGRWYLRKLKESEGNNLFTDDNVMWIEISTFNDRLEGFGACNKFAAVVKSDLNTTFSVTKITSGYTQCNNKKLENLFYELLEQTNRFDLKNGNLVLSDQWKFLIAFTSDPNNKEDINTTYSPPQSLTQNEPKTYAPKSTIETPGSYAENKASISENEADIQRQIEAVELQKKQQAEAEAAKKAEEERIAEQKRIEEERIKKEEEEKLAEQERIKKEEEKAAAKRAKLEELAKLQAELDALENGEEKKATTNQQTIATKSNNISDNKTNNESYSSNSENKLNKDKNANSLTGNQIKTSKEDESIPPKNIESTIVKDISDNSVNNNLSDMSGNTENSETGNDLKYRRSSLYTLIINDPSREYAETIKSSFINSPFPDKFNNHNLDIREINGYANSKDQKSVIDNFLNTNDIAKNLVAKWFNRSENGTFNMDLVAERGQYNATEMDVNNAKNTVRGLSLLSDAGEELIKNTFVVVTDFKYTNKEDVAEKTKKAVNISAAFLRFIPGASTGVSIAQTATNTTLTIAGKGYFVKATSYLYRLHWDEAVANKFYNDYWIDENSFDMDKKNAFDNSSIFTLDYIGSEVAKEQTQSSVFTNKTEEQLIERATVKSVDQVIARLQRNHDEFKTKTPLYSVEPIGAKIGLKEGLEGGDKYEVLEQTIDKNGKTYYKRVSVINVDKKNIWDNRYMASEENNNGDIKLTTFTGKSKGLYIGMLIRQIK